ncbi:hypothetical protein CAOG_004457 [Capsaspora owczarzaki ATCC 30864]|uniref:Uncharacterized protein n=2 Tax=Capsaspora owczarzaki (strain ATCC 30864) TaxID=595528 RepID=A0A0D2WRA7_CAPO3|nr:hypothetical protein CAOG_004457 [Capsaspora owczarzaki ATCC 30864]
MRQIAGACVVDCANIAQVMSEEKVTSLSLALRYQLFRDMSIPRDSRMAPQLSALFKKAANESGRRVVLMLDQFELLRKVATEDELHVMVKGMALDAVQANVHTVLINVADSEFAKKMESWNNNEKIVALESLKDFAWTKEELQAVVNQYRNHDVNLEYMTDEEADAAFAECDTVGKIVTARNRYVENRLPLNLELPKKL